MSCRSILGIPLLVAFAAGPRQFIQRQWRGLAALAVVALVIAAPLIRYSFVDSGAFNQRVATTSVLTGKSPAEARDALLENIRRHLLMFHVKGDPNGRHNLPGAPMLDPVTGGLFALGLVFAISRARRPEYALLVGWLALALLPPVLSLDFEAPQAYRGIGVTPVAALLAALGAGWLFSRAWEWRRRWQVGLAALPAVALGCAVVADFDLYFNKQLTDFSAWAAYSTPETLMARTIMTLPAGTRVSSVGVLGRAADDALSPRRSARHSPLRRAEAPAGARRPADGPAPQPRARPAAEPHPRRSIRARASSIGTGQAAARAS